MSLIDDAKARGYKPPTGDQFAKNKEVLMTELTSELWRLHAHINAMQKTAIALEEKIEELGALNWIKATTP